MYLPRFKTDIAAVFCLSSDVTKRETLFLRHPKSLFEHFTQYSFTFSMYFKFSNLFLIELNLTVTHLQCMYEFIKIIKTVLQKNYNRFLVVFPDVIYTHPTTQTNKETRKEK